MILLITNQEDLTCDYIVLELNRQGLPFYRLNTETIAREVLFSDRLQENTGEIYFKETHLKLSEIQGIYYRRPKEPILPASISDAGIWDYAQSEWKALLENWYATLPDVWLNHPFAIRSSECKLLQLQKAKALGFTLPDTLVSNDPGKIYNFIKNCTGEVVAKPLKTALMKRDGEAHVIFTSRLDKKNLPESGSLSLVPVIFQQEVPKSSDIRVTVVGNRVFTVSIDSQCNQETQVDWRRGENIELRHEVHELPETLRNQCIALVHKLNLRFGAIDLVLDTKGDYYFLEINPNGQWAWIESQTGLPISQAIVDELKGSHVISAC